MKQTAVEWLQEKFNENNAKFINWSEDYFNEAKEMEKQQIIDAYEEGYLQCRIYGLPQKSRKHYETSEQYYNETFKKEIK
jgi:hypothetical protein